MLVQKGVVRVCDCYDDACMEYERNIRTMRMRCGKTLERTCRVRTHDTPEPDAGVHPLAKPQLVRHSICIKHPVRQN